MCVSGSTRPSGSVTVPLRPLRSTWAWHRESTTSTAKTNTKACFVFLSDRFFRPADGLMFGMPPVPLLMTLTIDTQSSYQLAWGLESTSAFRRPEETVGYIERKPSEASFRNRELL